MFDAYKILHKPTGLFYRKAKADNKTNLSKIGLVFHNRPDLPRVLGDTYWHQTTHLNQRVDEQQPVDLSEWEVVPFD